MLLRGTAGCGKGREWNFGGLPSELFFCSFLSVNGGNMLEWNVILLLGWCKERKLQRQAMIFPQIAIAIGVLTSNRGGGRRTTLADWTWHQGAIAGAVDVVPLLGAIVGCHCSVLWLRRRVTTNFGGVDVVPLQGAIVLCYGGARAGWWPTLGEWTWWCHCRCHCSVLWLGGRVTTNFGGVDVVPLLGAIAGCQFLFHIFFLFSGPPISPRHPRKQQWILSWASCKRYTVLYIDNTKIGFGYLGSMLVLFFSELAAMSVNTIFHVLIQKAQAFEKGERWKTGLCLFQGNKMYAGPTLCWRRSGNTANLQRVRLEPGSRCKISI